VLGADPDVASRIAALVGRGGRLRLLLSAAAGDAPHGVRTLDPGLIASAYSRRGLVAAEIRPATLGDARAARSSWGCRLLADRNGDRQAWLVQLDRRR
jgi:hypothetical protein